MKKKILLTSLLLLFTTFLVSCDKSKNAPEIDTVNGLTLLKSQSLNGYIVTSYEGTDKVINVPQSHKGLDIVRIHFIAFTNSMAEEINLPKTVTAFFGVWRTFKLEKINIHPDNPTYFSEDGIVYSKNKELLIQFPQNHNSEEFVIPSYVKEINNNAFIQTQRLKKVTIHDDIEKINDLTFQYSNIEEVIISKTSKLKSIGELAFDHTKLSEIYLPESLEEIGYNAFDKTYITKIHLGSKVKTLNNSFEGLEYLEEITVDEKNPNFTAENNVLYNKNKTSLIHYPKFLNNSNYNLPSTVKNIENDSISKNLYLKNINTLSLDFKTSEGILYNKDYSQIIVYPKLNETRIFQVGLQLTGVEDIENLANSMFLEKIESDPNHRSYFSAEGVLYNREITELLIFPNANLVSSFYLNRVVERIRYENFSPIFLKELVVDEHNQFFASVDGVLYNKNKTQLLLVPQAKEIEEFEVHQYVSYISNGALNNPYIKNIVVNKNNLNYYDVDGVLYQKVDANKSILIKVPQAKEITKFTLLEDVFMVNENAFYYHPYIQEIDFSKASSVLTINNYAIINLLNLNKITININSVINENSFIYNIPLEIDIDVVKNDLYETLLWDFEWYKTAYKINIK